ncbi:FAD-dependent oxidoreductase [Nocardia abscessus]|uniref:FAD-dependent oxidoreductase n=1 Tax=Nocardia abscessus TaxID=120957 RepID=UPI0024543470|nr:FAD-dependent oxidoreductase [Nocardia abscessus]
MSGRNSVAPRAVAEIRAFDIETDVLVIGYGCAGAAAAFEAATAGARVLVLDRMGGPGGASALSGGEVYLGGGTPIQQACGFDDDPAAMAAFLGAALGPGADPDKIARYSEDSVAHFHWLADRGVPFKPTLWDAPTWVPPTDDGLMWLGENSRPFAELARPAPRGHRPTADDFGGKLLMDCLAEATRSAGAATLFDTRAICLIVAGDGTVAGVVARRYGAELAVRARRGVVLTTGGFVDNDAMLAAHAPKLLGHTKVSAGTDDGSGIRMAQAIGAGVRHMGTGQVGISLIPGLAARGMVVNGHGQRFVNEDTYPGRIGQAALFGQGMDTWVVLDEWAYEEVPERQRWGVRPTHVAETVEELAELMAVPGAALRDTVRRYNEFASDGADPEFGKAARWVRPLEPPFAAIDVRAGVRPPAQAGDRRGTGASVFTLGGLHTSLDGTVLDIDGTAIPGLFAAGRAASNLHGEGYISGTSLGDGTFFGRRAGVAAARDS